ncbi:hypothetical protein QBC47DRAFT_390816 [Echria macrotheca]|uniref:Protein FAF1 n=1 Tax=Echria macrotheca TaxID=438768 RepID=A0AAJ0B797_9PEZI|nr:hypothetical protein QBC47DRAFT_390816 [Echria macrotheca]
MSTLGKRKRAAAKSAESETSDQDRVQALLQQHFEARFKPIDIAPIQRASEPEEDDDDEEDDNYTLSDPSDAESDSEWGGISDGGDEAPKVEVVDHTAKNDKTYTMSKKELKEYLSSKPPSQGTASTTQPSRKPAADGDPEDSAAFLANDLALQRLIAESHILSAAGGNASHYLSTAAAATAANTRAFAEGRTRQKTTDMRIQALGAKGSVLEQAKMPMAMRKGIIRAAETREEKRRREARENGIVLERPSGKGAAGRGRKKSGRSRLEGRVDMPSVGKMRGAELRISAREIRAIEAEGRKADRGRRKKRR